MVSIQPTNKQKNHGGGPGVFARKRQREAELLRDPTNVSAQRLYALDLMQTGACDQAMQHLKALVNTHPDQGMLHSMLLFLMHYMPNLSRQEMYAEHLCWARRHATVKPLPQPVCDMNPDRRLRIGYVSPDFCAHAIIATFAAVLLGHDRQAFEVYGYGSVRKADGTTSWIQSHFDHYRDVHALSDLELAAQIAEDRIDILIAFAGHTGGHRLKAFAYRPAPIQIDFQGINTTGMEQMDIRLTDSALDPEGSQSFYRERLENLESGVVCYTPPHEAPSVGPSPWLRNGYITFGSFNAQLKMNPEILSLWARVLNEVPESRLLLKFPGAEDPQVCDLLRQPFVKMGLDPARLEFHGTTPGYAAHLAMMNEVDIGLDTYPYNGCITTLENLWMGIPVVTLTGDKYISRMGWTLLKHADMGFLSATTPDLFVAKAVGLARQTNALNQLRHLLRDRLSRSTLCNRTRYIQGLESTYRRLWQERCSAWETGKNWPTRTEVADNVVSDR